MAVPFIDIWKRPLAYHCFLLYALPRPCDALPSMQQRSAIGCNSCIEPSEIPSTGQGCATPFASYAHTLAPTSRRIQRESAELVALLGLGRREKEFQERRRVTSASVLAGISAGVAGWKSSGRLSTSFQPGGMTWVRMRQPLLSEPQQMIVGLSAAALGFVLGGDIARRHNVVSRGLRAVGGVPLRAYDAMRRAQVESRKRREREERERWLRARAKRSTIYR